MMFSSQIIGGGSVTRQTTLLQNSFGNITGGQLKNNIQTYNTNLKYHVNTICLYCQADG